jgi:hypothetical protein
MGHLESMIKWFQEMPTTLMDCRCVATSPRGWMGHLESIMEWFQEMPTTLRDCRCIASKVGVGSGT